MSEFILDRDLILKFGQKLADKKFLATESKWRSKKVHYTFFGNEIEFAVEHRDDWENDEVAETIADVFNEYGFNARSRMGWGYVWVQFDHVVDDLKREINDCFKEVISNEFNGDFKEVLKNENR